MTDARGQNEPTMEEILASIRRIISEDTQVRATASQPAAAAPDGPRTPALKSGGSKATTADPPPPPERPTGAPGQNPEVLDLTEMVTPDGSVVSLAARRPGAQAGTDPASGPADRTAQSSTVPNVPIPGQEARSAASPKATESQPMTSEISGSNGLMSESASTAAVTSLAGLARAVKREVAIRSLSAGDDRRIEDLAREALEPMMRDWLDKNLPGLVDRVVREEIEKIVRRLQDG